MGKFEITKAELVWPGKYDDDGKRREVSRISPLPFQVIERVNESRATREARKSREASLFDFWKGGEGDTFEEGWRNKLIWGDNLLVMRSLLRDLAGKVDLIYIDPPFATGSDFSFTTHVGEDSVPVGKRASIIEEKAYRDTWGKGRASWFSMMFDRLSIMRDLMSDRGTIYVHLDWYAGHHLRPVLDEIFGEENSLGEIIWAYGSPSGGRVSGSKLVKAHDTIFAFAKNYGAHKYEIAYLPYSDQYISDWFRHTDEHGRYRKRQRTDKETGKRYWVKQYLKDSKGVPASTVWTDIRQAYADPRAYKVGTVSEITGYATQKPEKLLERIIRISTDPGDLVADFFSGSGTTLATAERLGRRWIGCDLGRFGIHVTRKRMLGIADCRPFDVLNLGKYERQYWQIDRFGATDRQEDAQQTVYEYLKFILDFYGASPLPGLVHLHGRKGAAVVHVGAVDAPVTFTEIDGALEECRRVGQKELHVLGWEWEMGLVGPNKNGGRGGLTQQHAERHGIRLHLKRIPEEVMDENASERDVRFFELAHVDAVTERDESGRVRVRLQDFVVPHGDPETKEVREKIMKWMDWVDYWAVDWDFREDTFRQGWVAYRTRKDRSLPEESDLHEYGAPGNYRILVKVVDIFGNDTSLPLDVKVG